MNLFIPSSDIPNPDFSKLGKSAVVEQLEELKKQNELLEKQNVLLEKSAKQNWMQRHWIIWTIIISVGSALIGFLSNYILELLKQNHKVGL